MDVRQLTAADLDILLKIERATLGKDALNKDAALMVLNCGKVFGAFIGKKPVGVIEILFGKNLKEVFLWGYGVLPEYRGEGVAVALRQAAIRESIRLGRSLLYGEIRINNFPSIARRLQEPGGFIIDYLPDLYREKEDWFSAVTKLDIREDIERDKRLIWERANNDASGSIFAVGYEHIRLYRHLLQKGDKTIQTILKTKELGLDEVGFGPSIFIFGPKPEELKGAVRNSRLIPLNEAKRLIVLGNRLFRPRWGIMNFRLAEEFGDIVCVPDEVHPRAMAAIIYDSDPTVAYIWRAGAESGFGSKLMEKIKEVVEASGRKYIRP